MGNKIRKDMLKNPLLWGALFLILAGWGGVSAIWLPNTQTVITDMLLSKTETGFSRALFYFVAAFLCCGAMTLSIKILSVFGEKKLLLYSEARALAKFSELNIHKAPDRYLALIRKTLPLCTQNFVGFLSTTLQTVSIIVFSSVFIGLREPLVLCLTVVITLGVLLLTTKNRRNTKESSENFQTINQSMYMLTREQVANREIAPFLSEKKIYENYDACNREFLQALLKLKKIGNGMHLFAILGTNALVLLAIVVGGFFSFVGHISMAEIYGLVLVVPMLSKALFSLPDLFASRKSLQGAVALMDSFYQESDYEPDGTQNLQEPIVSISISIKEMGFEDKVLLKDAHLQIRSGEFIVLTGESGCGKSTLLEYVLGIQHCSEGNIFINQTPLEHISRNSYWEQVTYLSQKPQCIAGSIADNITLYENDEKRLQDAVHKADLEELIQQLPQGVHTQITGLSSGEQQKVCLARAFFQNKSVWFMDECTSALDPKSEQVIIQHLKEQVKNGTMILAVSHRAQFTQGAAHEMRLHNQSLYRIADADREV